MAVILKILRFNLGWNQQKFANALDTSIHSIRKWENRPKLKIKSKYEPKLRILIEEKPKESNEELVLNKFEYKVKNNLAKISFLREVVSLFFFIKDKNVSLTSKIIVFGGLAYFINPIDAIPDIIPITGYTDDAGVIFAVVKQLGANLRDEHRNKAEEWLSNL